jgi:hypothetical protein
MAFKKNDQDADDKGKMKKFPKKDVPKEIGKPKVKKDKKKGKK